MTTIDLLSLTVESFEAAGSFDEAELAAAAFLARYNGRTLDAYRHDLRTFFQWTADVGLAVLDATRPHIELYRTTLEQRALAASTIDRRLSTVCGFYRFAHIDGRIPIEPGPVRAPAPRPSERGPRAGPHRVGHVLVHRGTVRPGSRRTRSALGFERLAGQRSMRHQHRGPRLRTRTSHPGHHR